MVGDGPEREPLERLAAELGVAGRVRFHGALPPAEAVAVAQRGGLFVLPSVDEAFGVAYIEAMAAGVPAIGTRGEPGPEEIAAAGGGIRLVPARRSRRAGRRDPRPARRRRRAPRARRRGAGHGGARVHVGALRAGDRRGLPGRAAMKPVLFVTNHAPDFRLGAFAALHEAEDVVFALVGGRTRHGGAFGGGALPFPVLRPPQRAVGRLAASGRFRAVVAGLSGRVALPAAYLGARAGRVPFVLWATIWRHPRTPAHALSYLPLRHIYRHADAIATYGPHVSAYVRAKGPRGPVIEAPQSVDDAFWSAPAAARRQAPFQALYAGRLEAEKGVDVLLRGLARRRTAKTPRSCWPATAPCASGRATYALGPLSPHELRDHYAGSDVAVIPSIPTRDFLEPWGLVANEAMNRSLPVIATTAVGAAAGGLVRHEATGLVVPAGDAGALAAALRRLQADAALRARLGAAGREAVAHYSHAAWAAGMSRALAAAGVARSGC